MVVGETEACSRARNEFWRMNEGGHADVGPDNERLPDERNTNHA